MLNVLLSAALVIGSVYGPPRSELWGDLKRGAYDVGFTMMFAYDKSRPALSDSTGLRPESSMGRHMQISIWYPARESNGNRMTVARYAELLGQQLSSGSTRATRERGVELFLRNPRAAHLDEQLLTKLLDTRLMAVQDARHASGRFPLILFAHANPASASVMSEYLASNGFVVASIVSKGTREPDYRLSRADLETLTRDLEYTLSVVRTLSFTHPAFTSMHIRDRRVLRTVLREFCCVRPTQ